MKVGIIYDSITGNTKKIAEAIYEEIKNKCDVIIGDSTLDISNCDILFIGSWTDKGNCSKKISEVYKNLKNKRIIIFGTAGFGGSREYFDRLYKRIKEQIPKNNQIENKYFYCQGKMPNTVKERYIKMIKENPEDSNLQVSLKNFEEALKHPNDEDIENAKKYAKEIIENMKI